MYKLISHWNLRSSEILLSQTLTLLSQEEGRVSLQSESPLNGTTRTWRPCGSTLTTDMCLRLESSLLQSLCLYVCCLEMLIVPCMVISLLSISTVLLPLLSNGYHKDLKLVRFQITSFGAGISRIELHEIHLYRVSSFCSCSIDIDLLVTWFV